MAASAMSPSLIVGNPAESSLQGDGAGERRLIRRGLSLDTITTLRWIAVAGQAIVVGVAVVVLGYRTPYLLCALLIALSASVNLAASFVGLRGRLASSTEAALQLAFDVIQLTALLFLTGGTANPFVVLLIAPVTLAASSLPWRHAVMLAALAIAAAGVLAVWSMPLPWTGGTNLMLPLIYRVAAAASQA